MFELFGISPIIKIMLVVFILTYLSLYVGYIFVRSRTNNPAIKLITGLVFIIGVAALIITGGKTVFLPLLISLFVVFKPHFSQLKEGLRSALTETLQFFAIFFPFLLIEVFKQDYFNPQELNSSWGDYSFYVLMARELFQYGVEGTQVYLNDYSFTTHPNIYHYFDLYLLLPAYLAKVPPLISYLLYYSPLAYTIAAYCLIYTFKAKYSILTVFFAIITVHYLGLNFVEFEALQRISFVDFQKAIYILIPILFFRLRNKMSALELLILISALTLVLNPIISILSFIPYGIYMLYSTKFIALIKQAFKPKYLIIYLALVFYLFLIFSSGTDNSYVLGVEEKPTFMEMIKGALAEARKSLSILKLLPHFVLAVLYVGYRIVIEKKQVDKSIYLMAVLFVLGITFNMIFYKHYDGSQFFVIPLIAAVSLLLYYCLIKLLDPAEKLAKLVGGASLVLYLVCFFIGGINLYAAPKGYEPVSVAFSNKLMREKGDEFSINAVYFPKLDKNTKWIYYMPYLPFDIGYLQYYENTNTIKPISTSFFNDEYDITSGGLNLVSKAPFQRLCDSMKLKPENYYDADFETAIKTFIEQHGINTLIFNEEVAIPAWVEKFTVSTIVKPVEEIDDQQIFILAE